MCFEVTLFQHLNDTFNQSDKLMNKKFQLFHPFMKCVENKKVEETKKENGVSV